MLIRLTIFCVLFCFTFSACNSNIANKALEKVNLKKTEPCVSFVCRNLAWTDKFKHCGTFIHECANYTEASIMNQYSLQGFAFQYDPENSTSSTFKDDRDAFLNINDPNVVHQKISPPAGLSANEFVELIRSNANKYRANAYWPYGPNSNSAADFPLFKSGVKTNEVEGALGQHHYHKDTPLKQALNDAVKVFYEYASDRMGGLIDQIKSEAVSSGNFKQLNIGDHKTAVINGLKQMQAFYVSPQNIASTNRLIDLRTEQKNIIENQLLASDTWDVTYDNEGKTFWHLQLDFKNEALNGINIKSSGLELP